MSADSVAGAALAETHISVLVSIGDRVYKLKKPVSLGFLVKQRSSPAAEDVLRQIFKDHNQQNPKVQVEPEIAGDDS